MLELTMKLDQDVLSALRRSPDEFANEMRGARSQPDQLLRQAYSSNFSAKKTCFRMLKLHYRAPAKSMRAGPPLRRLMCRVLTVPSPARDHQTESAARF